MADAAAYNALRLNVSSRSHVVFVHSPPKVGSTSLVSSLRLFLTHAMDVIHVHDDVMLRVLTRVPDATVAGLVRHTATQPGKRVTVIDVYRLPVERAMSAFFEKLTTVHFPAFAGDLAPSPAWLARLNRRFTQLLPWLLEQQLPEEAAAATAPAPAVRRVLLRLQDSDAWAATLRRELGLAESEPLRIVRDYETAAKPVGELYRAFREQYRVPAAVLSQLILRPDFQTRNSETEKADYVRRWLAAAAGQQQQQPPVAAFSRQEYDMYSSLCAENSPGDCVQAADKHYLDEGCMCRGCRRLRRKVAEAVLRGDADPGRVSHEVAVREDTQERVGRASASIAGAQAAADSDRRAKRRRRQTISNVLGAVSSAPTPLSAAPRPAPPRGPSAMLRQWLQQQQHAPAKRRRMTLAQPFMFR
jgi:hypothetical protein